MNGRQRAVALAAVVLATLGAVGVFALGGGEELTAVPTSSTSVPADNPTPPSPAADAPSVATGGEAPAWQRPALGVYRYRFSRTGSGAAEYDATAVVAWTKNGFVETRDHQSFQTRRTYDVGTAGVRESGFVIESSSGPATCRWSRPVTVVPASRTEGEQWTTKATCTLTLGRSSGRVEIEETGRVVGTRPATVGGVTIPLLRVDRQSVMRTVAGTQSAERKSSFVNYFDTARGLLAQSTEDATETGPSGTTTYRIVETMLTVQPEEPKQ